MPKSQNTEYFKVYTTPERAEQVREMGGATRVFNALMDEARLLPLLEGLAQDIKDIRAAIVAGARLVTPTVQEPEDADVAAALAGMKF